LKILIVKLSSLGDVVHAMPAVQDIRRIYPDAQIDWVVERGFAPLVNRCEGVNRVIACELRRWRKSPFAGATRRAWRGFKAELQLDQYDAVIDLQGLTKSALISLLARLAPQGRRFGLANRTEGSSFEAPARWAADVAITVPAHIHAVARSRELCARALDYVVPLLQFFGLQACHNKTPGNAKKVAFDTSTPHGVVALVHGTSRADKQWPISSWQALGKRLNEQGYGVALSHGSDEEYQLAQQIANPLANATVWQRLGLDALTDALAKCAGVVGVDSGLSHIAVALDLPHVQLYNFDTAWRTGPLTCARQCSVFAVPTPSLDAVWRAWLGVSSQGNAL
jgi:heptosyltransferase-1